MRTSAVIATALRNVARSRTARQGPLMHARRLIAAGLTAPLLMFAGCAGEPDTPAAHESSEPASSASPSSSAATQPETLRDFLDRWAQVQTDMENSGETADFLALSLPKCDYCNRYADGISGMFDAGGFVKTGGWRILSIDDRSPGDSTFHEVWIHVDSAPTKYQEFKGAQVRRLSGSDDIEYKVVVKKVRNTWKIASVEEVVR